MYRSTLCLDSFPVQVITEYWEEFLMLYSSFLSVIYFIYSSSYIGEGKAPHSSILAWRIPWTEEPGGLQSLGSLRVRHDWASSLSLFTSCIGEGNGNPLQCSCLENPRDGGAWWAAVYGVAQNRTRLERLSSSSSSSSTYMSIPIL